ncbi:MAG: branched chain amino acid aminotransferase, partial [Rhodospirillales bacterium]
MAKTNIGKGLVYVDGQWRQGNPRILGPKSHAVWMSSVAFDGARAFQGVAPDLDRHCARAVRSAEFMGLAPAVAGPEIE